jgi:hypothetical protein
MNGKTKKIEGNFKRGSGAILENMKKMLQSAIF